MQRTPPQTRTVRTSIAMLTAAVALGGCACRARVGEPHIVADGRPDATLDVAQDCADGMHPVVVEQREVVEKPSVSIVYPAIHLPCARTTRDVNEAITGALREQEQRFLGTGDSAPPTGLPRDAFFLEIGCKAQRVDTQWVSVACAETSFTGGAHPWHEFKSFNFHIDAAKRAHLVELTDLFAMGWQVPVEKIAIETVEPKAMLDEEQLRKSIERGMPFALSEKGLELLFDPYAAGPYIAGSRTAVLGYARIAKLLRPGTKL